MIHDVTCQVTEAAKMGWKPCSLRCLQVPAFEFALADSVRTWTRGVNTWIDMQMPPSSQLAIQQLSEQMATILLSFRSSPINKLINMLLPAHTPTHLKSHPIQDFWTHTLTMWFCFLHFIIMSLQKVWNKHRRIEVSETKNETLYSYTSYCENQLRLKKKHCLHSVLWTNYREPSTLNCIKYVLLHPYLSLIKLAAYLPVNHITSRTFNFIHQCFNEQRTMAEIRVRHAKRSQYNIKKNKW